MDESTEARFHRAIKAILSKRDQGRVMGEYRKVHGIASQQFANSDDDLAFAEERRPGITKLVHRVQRENPRWPKARVMGYAKMLYSDRRIVAMQDGQPVEIDNPDYQAARNRDQQGRTTTHNGATPMNLNISPQIEAIHQAVAEIIGTVQTVAPNMSPDFQATTAMIVNAASVRLAELRTLLVLASGNGMQLPKQLRPLEAALNDAIEKAAGMMLADTGAAVVHDEMDLIVTIEQATLSLDQARIAGFHMLGHLGAAIERMERAKAPRLSVVGGTSTSG